MNIDTAVLDQEIERLQALKKVLSDPASLAYLRKAIVGSGVAVPPADAIPSPAPNVTMHEVSPQLPEGGESQIGLVRKCIAQLPESDFFTVSSLGELLRANGLHIKNLAISRILQRLANKYQEIELVAKGEGSSPNAYRATDKLKKF